MYILAMDFGTSSLKAAITNESGETVAETPSLPYKCRIFNGDWMEIDPAHVRGAFIEATKVLADYMPKVDAVAFDTFSPSPVFLDQSGEPLHNIVTHLDRRSKPQTLEILNVMGKQRFQEITGIQPFTGGASITTFMWFRKNMPEVFENAYKIGHLPTYIYHLLTGLFCSDPVNASMSGMYDTAHQSGWSKEITAAFGIPMDKLPDIYRAGEVVGALSEKAAALSGMRAGIPVGMGTNDCAAAQVGAGNENSGDVLIISGSSEMISILTDRSMVSDKYYFRNAALPGTWQIFAITASGFVIEWFRENFCRELTKEEFFTREFPAAIEGDILNNPVKFLPYMAGDRQSLETKRGAFTGLTLETTRRDMLSSILVGIHDPIVDTLKICGESMELNKKHVKLTGGMITPQFIDLKKKLMPGYEFEPVEDCTLKGVTRLVLKNL